MRFRQLIEAGALPASVWLGTVMLGLALGSGCAGPQTKPVEVLDQRTGVTVAVLEKPIEFVQFEGVPFGKRANFAYLGPVEWNRMGEYSYGLWLHVAPGNDVQIGDIQAPGAVTLLLDDGPWVLEAAAPPDLVGDAYRPLVTWGQAAYFELSVPELQRLAASSGLELQFHAADGSLMVLRAGRDAHAALANYVSERHLISD
jgi:hypothetical protein